MKASVLLGHSVLLFVLIYLGTGLIIWYCVQRLQIRKSDDPLGRNRGSVLKTFWEEMQWFLPGGSKRRADYIRDLVESFPDRHGPLGINGHFFIKKRLEERYQEIMMCELGTGLYFWVSNVGIVFLWPIWLVGILLNKVLEAFDPALL